MAERETGVADGATAWERCGACRGYGVVEEFGGGPTDCLACRGEGIRRCRDERGRFSRG